MLITKAKLEELGTCKEAVEFFTKHYESIEVKEFLRDVLKYEAEIREKYKVGVYRQCYKLLTKFLSRKASVEFAVFATEQVLSMFEQEYPNECIPRKAIEAAKACIANPNEETAAAAKAVWCAAEKVVDGVSFEAATRTALVAWVAISAKTVNVADIAASVASQAVWSTEGKDDSFVLKVKNSILDYGISLMENLLSKPQI